MYRASAKEGTYVITMDTSDPSYTRTKALNFLNDYKQLENQQTKQFKKLQKQWKKEINQEINNIFADQSLSYSERMTKAKAADKAFMQKQIKEANRQLIEAHNWLLQNANKNGFHYGLERRE